MKTTINHYIYIIIVLFLFSCNKDHKNNEIELLRNGNKDVYSSAKLDSSQVIASITNQKLQELYDISALYSSGNKNTAIDSLNYNQIQGYFLKKDSNNIKALLQELDSMKVNTIKVKNLEIETKFNQKDTLNYANYLVVYKDKNQKNIAEFQKKSIYRLEKSPVKFQKEFKFYFVKLDAKQNDSISVGTIK